MAVLAAIVLLFVVAGWLESRWYQGVLKKIPLRILVNGTRGKTSVTRLLAAALNGAGIRTCAKTTGSEARWIDPEGKETDYRKKNPPRIMEQGAFFRFAATCRAEAVVVECMALRKENQRLFGSKLIRQQFTVLTNAFVDHVEEIGWTQAETVRTLALSIHPGSTVVTGEAGFAGDAKKLLPPVPDVPEHFASLFSFPVHQVNLALVLAVTDALGIKRADAMAGMLKAQPDIGMHGWLSTKGIKVYNAFSANDPESFREALQGCLQAPSYLLLYNHRADRSQRLRLIVKALCQSGRLPERLGVMGEDKARAARFMSRQTGLVADVVEDPFRWLFNQPCQQPFCLLCAGNIKGAGHDFLQSLIQEGAPDV